MEVPSSVREHEVYVSPEPDADREPEWPPASRAIAIERARRARLEQGGLATDDATLERVANAVLDPGYALPGLYYTAEELDDEIGDDLRVAVRAYLDRHPEIDGGVRIGWRDGRRTRLELAAAGFRVAVTGADPDCGVTRVELIGGRDESAAKEFFAARYGEAVAVTWLGPRPLREVPHPFASWTSAGRRMRVFFGLDRNGQECGTARVAEQTDERIVIALSCLQPVGPTTLIGGFVPHHADLELREPVGVRAVIDASAGVARPSIAQLRSG